MIFQVYVDENRKAKANKPGAEHRKHWIDRINAQGLQDMGEEGAKSYIAQFGKSIGFPKCIAYARLAEENGYPDFALGFWKKAFSIEHPGEPFNTLSAVEKMEKGIKSADKVPGNFFFDSDVFPEDMYPGKFVPMQPSDAKHPREYYIKDPRYIGQHKIKGEKLIAFVTRDEVFWQSRSMLLQPAPALSGDLEDVLKKLAKRGAFILEGEAVYINVQGEEFMSSSTCATSNIKLGSKQQPQFRYYVFMCWFDEGVALNFQSQRIEHAQMLVFEANYPYMQIVETAYTEKEKRKLCERIEREGREGEVWSLANLEYFPDKNTKDTYVRTKHKLPPTDYIVGKIEKAKAADHIIGSCHIFSKEGKPMGKAFTNDRALQGKIQKIWDKRGVVTVVVVAQEFSPYGKLIHPVIIDAKDEAE